MKYFTSACSALVISAHAFPAIAQTNLEEIVVTANRLEQSTDALMVATTVITRQEIEASMAQNLTELLLGKAGIQMAQSGGQGSQTSLFLRGTESDHASGDRSETFPARHKQVAARKRRARKCGSTGATDRTPHPIGTRAYPIRWETPP